MCILFVHVEENPQPNLFKVILAVNRDESYKRPTKAADFWGTQPDIVGGRDMEPGREGGTWLAMSKTGKIAALLNVLQSKNALNQGGTKKGRGFLVNDFLKSSKGAIEYLTDIKEVASEYNPFTIFTLDVLSRNAPQICYYTCSADNKPVELATATVHGIGNCSIETPFIKVKTGKEAFEKVVQENNHVTKRDSLIQGIIKILKDPERFHPDPQILKHSPDYSEVFIGGLSSRFIELPGYGTRTHTIILIDHDNYVFYKELTLTEPINEGTKDWTESTFEFAILDKQVGQKF